MQTILFKPSYLTAVFTSVEYFQSESELRIIFAAFSATAMITEFGTPEIGAGKMLPSTILRFLTPLTLKTLTSEK